MTEDILNVVDAYLFMGLWLVIYLPAYWGLSRLFKNLWIRWLIVWVLVSSLDFLSSYMRDDYPDSSLTPFEITMTLPGGLAELLIIPFMLLRFQLIQWFLVLLGRDPYDNGNLSDAWFSGERGGWHVFVIDFSMDLVVCGLIFLLTRPLVVAWRRFRAKPTPTLSAA